MSGRPVPHHGSGGGLVSRRSDPDETAGRALYRALANREAALSLVGVRRKVRLRDSAALAALDGGSE